MPLSTAVFKTAVIDHSTISPKKNNYPQRFAVLFYFSTAKLVLSSEPTKNYTRFFSLLSFFFVTGNVFFNFAL